MRWNKSRQLCYQIGGTLLILQSLAFPLLAQAKKGSSPAQAAYEAGVTAKKKGDDATAAAEFRKAIELDRNFVEAHLGFLEASLRDFQLPPDELNAKKLEVMKLYDEWGDKWRLEARKQYGYSLPGGPYGSADGFWAVLLAKGFTADMTRGGLLWAGDLHNAVMHKPDLAGHLRRMPEDYPYSEVMVKCAFALRIYDPDHYKQLVESLIAEHPNDPATMAALYQMAEEAETVEQRIKLYERIRTDFSRFAYHDPAMEESANQYGPTLNSYNLAMWQLFGAYLKTDQSKALSLAEEMSRANPADRRWAAVRSFQEVIASKAFELGGGQFAMPQVSVLLADVATGTYQYDEAYEFLSKLIVNRHEAEPYQSALYKLGEKLNKAHQQVDEELWQLRYKNAKQTKDFELSTYDSKKVKLSDYRGKVVVLNLWAPY